MKVLYAAYRHNPQIRGAEVGSDYHFFHALQDNNLDVRLVGPFQEPPAFWERAVKRFYIGLSHGKYAKYDLSNTLRASREVSKVASEWHPDVIFSLYPPPLAFYIGTIPCVLRTDVTFLGLSAQAPEFLPYGKVAFLMNVWLERRAIQKSAMVITHSEWARQSLLKDYQSDARKISVYPNPAALPAEWIPKVLNSAIEKKLTTPLRLLLIGRDPYRKGLDIAIDIVKGLNCAGIPTHLTICGMKEENEEFVTYLGNLSKANETEREQYLAQLRSAHLLLHPARLDPSPRVTSEAAAFGTPTITSDIGGLATSVKHGVSGLVLSRNSLPEAYVQSISELVAEPEHYYALCQSTRQRYNNELNSEVAGRRLVEILAEVKNKK